MKELMIADYLYGGANLTLDQGKIKYQIRSGIHREKMLADLSKNKAEIINQLSADSSTAKWMPVAENQKALYLHQAMNPEDNAYNIIMSLEVPAQYCGSACKDAMEMLLNRHISLSRVYIKQADQVYQRVTEAKPVIELDSIQINTTDHLTRMIESFSRAPFKLDGSALCRVIIHSLDIAETQAKYQVTLVSHHLNLDFWSIGILIKDFFNLLSEPDSKTIEPGSDLYLEHIKSKFLLPDSVNNEHYWPDKISEAYSQVTLPVSEQGDKVLGPLSDSLRFSVDSLLKNKVSAAAKFYGVTEFVLVSAALFTLINRITNDNKLSVCIPTMGRSTEQYETVGYYVNPIPLMIDYDSTVDTKDLLSQIKYAFFDAMDNDKIAYTKIIQSVRTQFPDTIGDEYPVFFNWNSFPDMEGVTDVLESATIDQVGGFCELMLTITETPSGYDAAWTYKSQYQDLIPGWHALFIEIIEAISSSDCQFTSDLPVISKSDMAQINQLNHTDHNFRHSTSVPDIIREASANFADNTALVFAETEISYAELEILSNNVAQNLLDSGASEEHFIGVCAERSVELVVALIAIMKLGAAYVPIDSSYPDNRIKSTIEDSAISFVLTTQHTDGLNVLQSLKRICLQLNNLEKTVAAEVNHADKLKPAYMLYTSGSTGTPKGVVITHQAIINRLAWMQDKYNLKESDRVLQKTQYSFDVSIWEFFWPLMVGATLVIVKPDGHKDPEYLIDIIQREKITHLHFVPSMLQVFLSFIDSTRHHSIKHVFCSGEELTPAVVKKFFNLYQNTRLHNLYGPTEAAVDVSYYECTSGDGGRSMIPIGQPVANTKLHILNSEMQPVPVGSEGDIYISGVQLSTGYHGRPELNMQRFVTQEIDGTSFRLYKTGDVARWNIEGHIEYLGRNDDQVKIRGQRVELGEIDAMLSRCEQVRYAASILDTQSNNPVLLSFVVLTGPHNLPEAEIKRQIKTELFTKLPLHMMPSDIQIIAELPVTANGKLDRKYLSNAYKSAQRDKEKLIHQTDIDLRVMQAWNMVLGDGREWQHDDNFFLIGGDSIKALRLIGELNNSGIAINTEFLYKNPTLSDLSLLAADCENPVRQTDLSKTEPVATFSQMDKTLINRDPELLHDAYPLTRLQEIMYTHSVMNPNAAVYHDVFSVFSDEVIGQEQLAANINTLTEKHEALRTRLYNSEGGDLCQVVLSRVKPDLIYREIELSADLNSVVNEEIERQKGIGFDFEHDNLIRYVHLTNGQKSVFILCFHHLILDGWSVASLITDIFSCLDDYQPAQAELTSQYRFADYVHLESIHSHCEVAKAYWENIVKDKSGNILGESKYHSGLTYNDVVAEVMPISAELSKALTSKAAELNIPLKTLSMAAHCMLLSNVISKESLLTGYVTNGRIEEAGYEKVLGLHLNTLPLVAPLVDKSLNEFVNEICASEIEAMPYRGYPLYNILKNAKQNKLFNTVFNFTNFHVYSEQQANEMICDIKVHEFTDFDFVSSFSVHPRTGNLSLSVNYNRKNISSDLIAKIKSCYPKILSWLVDADKNSVVSDVIYEKFLSRNPESDLTEILNALPLIANAGIWSSNDDNAGICTLVPHLYSQPQVHYFNKISAERLHELPNGMQVSMLNRSETDFVYGEIFESSLMQRFDIKFSVNPVIFDIGANIGLFSLYISNLLPQAKIYSYEPVGPVFDILKDNLNAYMVQASVKNLGLSSSCGTAVINYYEGNTLISGQYACDEDVEVSAKALINTYKNTHENAIDAADVYQYLQDKLVSHELEIELSTLSYEIEQHNIAHIDLLKIDVEKAEIDVIQGIDDKHWPLIENLFIEVHDIDGRLQYMSALLDRKGYFIYYEQDAVLLGTNVYSLFASRSEIKKRKQPLDNAWRYSKNNFIEKVLSEIDPTYGDILKSYQFELSAELDLPESGQDSPKCAENLLNEPASFGQEHEVHCATILEIWSSELNKTIRDPATSFYAAGGDSISLLKIIRKINYEFGTKVPVFAIQIDHSARDMLKMVFDARKPSVVINDKGGDGDISLLFVVPYATPSHVYDPIIEKLLSSYNVKTILITDDIYEKNDLSAIAEDVVEKVSAHLTDSCMLAGWSLGGNLCIAMSEKYFQQTGNSIPIILFDTHFTDHESQKISSDFISRMINDKDDPYIARRIELIQGYRPSSILKNALYFRASNNEYRKLMSDFDCSKYIQEVNLVEVKAGHYEIIEEQHSEYISSAIEQHISTMFILKNLKEKDEI
jgi:amino acid adenylation domain-containing protein/FkbM family methyltransferase